MSEHLWNNDLERAVIGVVLDGRHASALAEMEAHSAVAPKGTP